MICLSFDSDYVTDKDMHKFINEFPFPGNGTYFLHQKYSVDWKKNELGPHPFLNNKSNWKEQLKKLIDDLGISPKGIRTHSCMNSHAFCTDLKSMGFEYNSQTSRLFQTDILPQRESWGLWELPVYYMDNQDLCFVNNWPELKHKPFNKSIIEQAVNSEKLFVFDFHPLHLILNTVSYQAYCDARNLYMENDESPFNYTMKGYGVRSFFFELCEAMDKKNMKSMTCIEALNY